MDEQRGVGAVVLCVGSHGVAESVLRVAGARARRTGRRLRLLHVAEETTPLGLEVAETRLDRAARDAHALLGGAVLLERVLVAGDVLDGVTAHVADAALVVIERPAVVRLSGLVRRTSLTAALVEHLEVPMLVVPGLWPTARVQLDGLPPSWHAAHEQRTVAVLLDDPASCRPVVNAGLESAADVGGSVELVRGWEADRVAVVEASRGASLVVVGRDGDRGLSVAGKLALHESLCPVLVIDAPVEDEPLAEVIPLRRRAEGAPAAPGTVRADAPDAPDAAVAAVASRSSSRCSRGCSPAPDSSARVAGACARLVSRTSTPVGASQSRAPAATRRWTSSPSGPPSRATRGSWSRASGGISATSRVGTYGALTTSTSTRPARSTGRAANRSPSWTRPGGRLRRAQATAAGSTSAACTSASGRRCATAAPRAPVPQPRSTTTPPGGSEATASRTSSPLRDRGTKTPGAVATRSPSKAAHPTSTSSGSPATRRATRASSAGPLAAERSRAASSSAYTQPAARSRATSGSERSTRPSSRSRRRRNENTF